MSFYDIFNGDADGICALHQLRLVQPRRAALVTGVKRDIRLLRNVTPATGDELTVLDISLDANRAPLSEALRADARVRWFDHHYPGEIPRHPCLEAHIDTDPQTCTSLIVDRHLGGQHGAWAIVAAFGDNLDAVARKRAHALGFGEAETRTMRELGIHLNYNAYGESVADLRFAPDELYARLHPYADPLAFARESTEFETLRQALAEDLERAAAVPVEQISPGCALVVLPEQAWSRRVIGAFANRLAQGFPSRAHAVLVRRAGGFMVSLRAPVSRPTGADVVARGFSSGGGREGAAGVDALPEAELPRLLDELRRNYPGR